MPPRSCGGEKSQSACKPGSVWPRPRAERDGHSSGTTLARRLWRPTRAAIRKRISGSPLRRPYSVLLPAGLAMPPASPPARCALTAPFHPDPDAGEPGRAVCFLWRYPWGRPRRTLSGAVFPWSPDFPLPQGSGRPADWPPACRRARAGAQSCERRVRQAEPAGNPRVVGATPRVLHDSATRGVTRCDGRGCVASVRRRTDQGRRTIHLDAWPRSAG